MKFLLQARALMLLSCEAIAIKSIAYKFRNYATIVAPPLKKGKQKQVHRTAVRSPASTELFINFIMHTRLH
jgi:hypothetical protein